MDEEIDLVRRGGKPICGHGIMGGHRGGNEALVLNGQPMDGIARVLSGVLDRHVLNKTGIDGRFVLYLEYAQDDMTPVGFSGAAAAEPPTAPGIATVLQEQLGLKLEPTKGPKGYIVIDHIERPTPDSPASAPTSLSELRRGLAGALRAEADGATAGKPASVAPPARVRGAGR